MRKWTQRRNLSAGNMSFFLCLGLLTVFFLAGLVLGQVSARRNSDPISAELHQYLMDYYSLGIGEESGRLFLSALLIYFRYPLMAFCLSFILPGALSLPLVAAAFGFFLSYAACCFARTFGEIGVLLSVAVFGLRCLISIPCFFVLAVPAVQKAMIALYERFFGSSKRLQVQRLGLEWWLVACVIAAILLGGALSEVLLAPVFLRSILPIL